MGKFYEYMTDLQQLKPAGWCPACGAEIWAEGKNLCSRCEKGEISDNAE